MRNLTPKQKLFLDYLTNFHRRHGYSPKREDIAKHFAFNSLGTIENYVTILERKGYLMREPDGLRVLEFNRYLPCLGKVAAGIPIGYVQAPERVEVPESMLRG